MVIANMTNAEYTLLISYTIFDVFVLAVSLTFLTILLLNFKTLSEPYYIYIRSLAVAHIIMIGSLLAYVTKSYYMANTSRNLVYTVVALLHNIGPKIDMHINLFVSLNRFYAVVKSQVYKQVWTSRLCLLTIVLSILLSLGLTVLGYLSNNEYISDNFSLIQYTYTGVGFCVMFLSYLIVVLKVLKRHSTSSVQQNSNMQKREMRLMFQAALTSLLVFSMWLTEFVHATVSAKTLILTYGLYESFCVLVHTCSYAFCDTKLKQAVRGASTAVVTAVSTTAHNQAAN